MSLGRMLTKVVLGVAVAKGMQAVTRSGGLGKLTGRKPDSAGNGNRVETQPGGASTGGLPGGLSDIMGNLGAGAGGGGSLGGLLGGLAAGRSGQPQQAQTLEDLLSRDAPVEEPPAEDNAGLMIRAMVMAARCDGEIDANERQTLMATIGEDASPEDMEFVRAAMDAPVNARQIADDTPKGMDTQVYSMSLMAIEPDHPEEAKYLHTLASSLGIGQATVNEIHDSFGVQRLYS